MANNPLGVLTRSWRSLFGKPEPRDEEVAHCVERLADLNIISAAIHHGCMGLPQELIDCIMDILHNDLKALKACSLTCKAMFVSARPLIHRTAYLDLPIVESVLTREEKGKHPRQRSQGQQRPAGNSGAELRFAAYMDDHNGLLRYARKLHIKTRDFGFTPNSLLPYLHKFQSLDRVHTLAILDYQAITWGAHFRTCFLHFYPTLTTLALRYPSGRYKLILQFALQFPNLENLYLEWLLRGPQGPALPVVIDQSPPFRGRLRLAGNDAVTRWLAEFAREFPNGPKFRSIELDDFFGDPGQDIFSACANTLECVTIKPQTLYEDTQLRNLNFAGLEVLRRFTFRQAFPQRLNCSPEPLLEALSTIESPVFCELELELTPATPPLFLASFWGDSRYWRETDAFLEERFTERGDFKLVIRLAGFPCQETLRKHADEAFPLLARRGCIRCEVLHHVR